MSHSIPSSGNDAEVTDILHRTRFTLEKVEFYLEGFPAAPDRKLAVAAMHNVVVTGRMVTFVLQNLRSKVEDFDVWYQPWVEEMARDPLLQYFKDLRNKIEKQGREGATNILTIQSASLDEIMSMLGPAPPNAISSFVGDYNGGSGWEVQLEDGTIQKVYVALPESDNIRSRLAFEKLPGEHLGAPITDDSLENICRLYVQYLRHLVEAAEEHFSPAAPTTSPP